ncbi:MAG: hypothetical protein ACTSVS_09320 [Candidatus Heimdallarchaeota archaeon]
MSGGIIAVDLSVAAAEKKFFVILRILETIEDDFAADLANFLRAKINEQQINKGGKNESNRNNTAEQLESY